MQKKETVPLGKGANVLPQPCFTTSPSVERTRWPSASVPQKKGTLPSASCTNKIREFSTQPKETSQDSQRDDTDSSIRELLTDATKALLEELSKRTKANFP